MNPADTAARVNSDTLQKLSPTRLLDRVDVGLRQIMHDADHAISATTDPHARRALVQIMERAKYEVAQIKAHSR